MKLTPKTDKELAEASLFPAGVYDFEIIEADETVSKRGADMIKLKLRVFDASGRDAIIWDYLLEAMPHKVKHIAEMADLTDKYESGELKSDDLLGKCGKAKIVISKDKRGEYPDQNSVADYIVEIKTSSKSASEEIDDSVPF